MTTRPVFDQRIPGFVAYHDNGDGTFAPVEHGSPATAPLIVNLFADIAPAPGSGTVWGPFVIPNDGRVYWLVAAWVRVGPGTAVTDEAYVQIEDANSGATLSLIVQAIRQSTTLYTPVSWSGAVPVSFGQRVICRYLNSSGAAVDMSGSAVLLAY